MILYGLQEYIWKEDTEETDNASCLQGGEEWLEHRGEGTYYFTF